MATLRSGQYSTLTASSQKFAAAMLPGQKYLFTASQDCYVKVTATGGSASAAADNILYIKGQMLVLRNPSNVNTTDAFVHFIELSADGVCTLMLIEDD